MITAKIQQYYQIRITDIILQHYRQKWTYGKMISFANFGMGFMSISTSTWNESIDIQLLLSPQVSWYSEPIPNIPLENVPFCKNITKKLWSSESAFHGISKQYVEKIYYHESEGLTQNYSISN